MSAKSTRPISRPVFLNLLKIKLPMNAVASITHRLSGMYVFFITLPMSLALLFLSKKSETTFTYLKAHLNELNFLSFFVYISFLIFFYHLLTGIRHWLQDLHIGDSMNMLNISARGIIVIWLIALILVFTSLWWMDQ